MLNIPAYNGNSLVNLMSSLTICDNCKSDYPALDIFPDYDKKRTTKIVHIIIDGLGYDYLTEYKRDSFLYNHLTGRLTSVFPTTTAAALTTIATGMAPGEHGITGWYMHLEGGRLKNPAVILPFLESSTNKSLLEYGFTGEMVFPAFRLSKMQANCRVILPVEYRYSLYNKFMLEGAQDFFYQDFEEFFRLLEQITCDEQNGYLYAYLPHFDDVFHQYGEKSAELSGLFNLIDSRIAALAALKNDKTILIINSDHGLTDNREEHCLKLSDYPKISGMLSFPLCGEARMVYCMVKDEYKSVFKDTVLKELGGICEILSFKEAVDLHLFGLLQNHPHLLERTGDFLLLMREGYVLKDTICDKPITFHKADHGGLTSKELYIPLIVI